MPDITMCRGDKCPLKNKCYRYTATPSEYWQSWFLEVPYNHKMEECEEFWNEGSSVHDS